MPSGPLRLGVLLSGGGRTLQNLVDRIAEGSLDAEIRCVISDREAGGLERGRKAGIPAYVEAEAQRQFALLAEHGVELVCLAGYLRLVRIPPRWHGRVLNIHPALLPRHGGKGCYGERVHRAVLEAGDRETGCTVHFCDEEYDRGPVLLQRRVPVEPDDSLESLAERVFAAECEAYPDAIRLWAERCRGGA